MLMYDSVIDLIPFKNYLTNVNLYNSITHYSMSVKFLLQLKHTMITSPYKNTTIG